MRWLAPDGSDVNIHICWDESYDPGIIPQVGDTVMYDGQVVDRVYERVTPFVQHSTFPENTWLLWRVRLSDLSIETVVRVGCAWHIQRYGEG